MGGWGVCGVIRFKKQKKIQSINHISGRSPSGGNSKHFLLFARFLSRIPEIAFGILIFI